jgi:mannitol-specific phosphotransferase system IIBC component
MKRFLLIGVLAVAAASFFTRSAGAQDMLQRPGALARTPSFGSLTASIAATPKATELVTKRTVTVADIRVVDATTVIGSDNAETVKTALDTHKDHITALREAISKNAAYTAALAAHKDKPEVSTIIAVDILESGDVLVYFKK